MKRKHTNKPSVLVIDNYDSFVYNLVHYLEDLDCVVRVVRNDELNIEEVENYNNILLSPGPGIPEEAGLLKNIISEYASSKNILGVCLGHQAVGEVFGARLVNLAKVYHGVATEITITQEKDILFQGLPERLQVGRYHSWIVDSPLPHCLEATSFDEEGNIMSLRHKVYNVYGVQFHPESVLTPQGKMILENWVKAFPQEKTIQGKEFKPIKEDQLNKSTIPKAQTQ